MFSPPMGAHVVRPVCRGSVWTYPCALCHDTTASIKGLRTHLRTHRKEDKPPLVQMKGADVSSSLSEATEAIEKHVAERQKLVDARKQINIQLRARQKRKAANAVEIDSLEAKKNDIHGRYKDKKKRRTAKHEQNLLKAAAAYAAEQARLAREVTDLERKDAADEATALQEPLQRLGALHTAVEEDKVAIGELEEAVRRADLAVHAKQAQFDRFFCKKYPEFDQLRRLSVRSGLVQSVGEDTKKKGT